LPTQTCRLCPRSSQTPIPWPSPVLRTTRLKLL
jgi:hypothetical protein